MSRRPPSGGDRTEQNRATLKQLVKLEANKSCADCKTNKHPRWASWSLGVFLCIRCSGVHRGMGTHISRVKSVDLDSWTDEQTQNMIRWGNTRANKYWEHKLADGHVPNEAKIANFIKTKYDSKRWVMDGPMPDPSTLDDGSPDDDVPLNVVREKAIERSASLRNGAGSAGQGISTPPSRAKPQDVDLFGDVGDEMAPPARPSTTEPGGQRAGTGMQKAPAAPPKQTKPGESLLGIDFFGGASTAAPARPSSTGPTTPGVPGRADLKSSILSLYASKPAPPPPQQQPQQQPPPPQSNIDAFAGMQSPPLAAPIQTQPNPQQSFAGMNDAFGSLSFTSPPQQQTQPIPQAFSNPTASTSHTRQTSSKSGAAGGGNLLSGGSFFDPKPVIPPKQTSPPAQPATMHAQNDSIGSNFGDFSTAASPSRPAAKIPPAATSSMGDLFDMSAPAPPPKQAAPKPAPPPIQQGKQPPPINYSAFNLSQQPPAPQPQAASSPPKPAAPPLSNFTSLSNMDAWGSNDAWATPDVAPSQPAAAPPIQTNVSTTTSFKPASPPAMQTPFDSGWGDAPTSPQRGGGGSGGFSVQQDEEFGGWSHSSPVATSATSAHASKPSGGGGTAARPAPPPMTTDDLFGNVWG